MNYQPVLGADPVVNHKTLQDLFDNKPAGTVELPPGRHRLADGLRVGGGWTVRGSAPGHTSLVTEAPTGHPVLHVLGSHVTVSDVTLEPAPVDPGEHGGDRGTGLTIGEYLYDETPQWIDDVTVSRVHVDHARRTANGFAVMGAVRGVTLRDLAVRGGYTGLAVHWGAAGADVASISGPTFHPHRLDVSGLRVTGAIEGFYLSSVHDVRVHGACLHDVEMGFRLLPGDNTDRFVGAVEVGARIDISDICVRWAGPRYAVRIAGWGRSEVDGMVSVLTYRDATIRDCRLTGMGTGDAWSPVVIEQATGVELHDVRVATAAPQCCRPGISEPGS